ncbi:MAG: hypothetical protein H3C34_03490 [Caldilineaceae bacterium]|nr:hypothetical protein [Caldilineaceae bacterium]
MKAFQIMGRTLKGVYDELFLIVMLSVVWWIGTMLVVTAPMTWVGLNHVANRMANYKRVDFGFFWEGARKHLGRGVVLWLLVLIAPPIMLFSITFYLQQGGWLVVLGVVMFWITLLFFLAAQYFYPLFWQQTEPSTTLVLRNAFLLSFRHPLYSILMLIFQVVLVALSIALVVPVILLLPGMLALSHNYALVGLLQEMNLAPPPPEISGT